MLEALGRFEKEISERLQLRSTCAFYKRLSSRRDNSAANHLGKYLPDPGPECAPIEHRRVGVPLRDAIAIERCSAWTHAGALVDELYERLVDAATIASKPSICLWI
jgi:hypothetical protein